MLRRAASKVKAAGRQYTDRLIYGPLHPVVVYRMDKLREDLAKLKEDIDTRQFLIKLVFYNGFYCASCSEPRGRPGNCGPTCPLLRPKEYHQYDTLLGGIDYEMSNAWIRQTLSIARSFDLIAGEVLDSGYRVDPMISEHWVAAPNHLFDRLHNAGHELWVVNASDAAGDHEVPGFTTPDAAGDRLHHVGHEEPVSLTSDAAGSVA